MPLYIWVDKKTGTQVDVLRSFAEYEKPPEGDEIPEELRETDPEWEREIQGGQAVVKGNGWGSGKGFW